MEKVTGSIDIPNIGIVNYEIDNEPFGVWFDYPKGGTNREKVTVHNPLTNRNTFKLSFPHYKEMIDGDGNKIGDRVISTIYDADVIDEVKYRFFSEMYTNIDILMRASINHLLTYYFGVIAFDPENEYAQIS